MRRACSRTWRPTLAAYLTLGALSGGVLGRATPAGAEVTRVDVIRRADVGHSGYEKIVGTIHFAIDPADPHNAVLADIEKVTPGADHRVAFSADLYILRPKDPARSNGAALIEVANRGNKGLLVRTSVWRRVAGSIPRPTPIWATGCSRARDTR